MAGLYEVNRTNFNRIVDAYMNYVALYRLFNAGKTDGVTPFNVFYWRMTYHVRYGNGETVSRGF